MTTFVAFLRGINVSGARPLPMAQLRSLCEDLGFQNVQTYLQSGNVVFKAKGTSNKAAMELSRTLENAIFKRYKYDVPVIVRMEKEIGAIILENPFLKKNKNDAELLTTLHVTLLSEQPKPPSTREQPSKLGPDTWCLHKKTIYLHCPNGYGKTKLTNTFFEKQFECSATTRNWNTLTSVYELCKLNSN